MENKHIPVRIVSDKGKVFLIKTGRGGASMSAKVKKIIIAILLAMIVLGLLGLCTYYYFR